MLARKRVSLVCKNPLPQVWFGRRPTDKNVGVSLFGGAGFKGLK